MLSKYFYNIKVLMLYIFMIRLYPKYGILLHTYFNNYIIYKHKHFRLSLNTYLKIYLITILKLY